MTDWLTPAVLIALGGGAGAVAREAFGWLKSKPTKAKDDADLMQAAGVFQAALNAAADGVVARMAGEIERLNREVSELRRSHQECEGEARRLADEVAQAKGEVREHRQVTESLVRELRSLGVDVTDLTGQRPLIVLHANTPEAAS